MSKRRVPAALHHELSEYASLLRALRTRDTMDITKHLTKPSPFALDPKDRPENAKGKEKATDAPAKPKQIRRDHWTRWPLLLDDVLKPEWTLEDEVAVIAAQVMTARPHPLSKVPLGESPASDDEDLVFLDMEVEEDDPDHPPYVAPLTNIIADYMSTILAQLASQTPARPASMQNRVEPLNWRAVIDAVVSCGHPELISPQAVENVIKRMEAIYGPSISPLEGKMATSSRAVERIRAQSDAQEKARERLDTLGDDFFSQASPPPYQPGAFLVSPKRKQKRAATYRKEEKDFVARKKWVPKSKQNTGAGQTSETTPMEEDNSANAEKPRRSSRSKSKVNYREIVDAS